MNQEHLQQLIADGLVAMKAGGRVAAAATDEIQQAASDPELKSALEAGNETAKTWQTRIERALGELGATGEGENPILEAHYQVSRKIRDTAQDEQVRDLGIIASGQLALHYWIAAFGTMKAYARQSGLGQTEQEMSRSVEEAKQADEQHTEIAARIMG
ncbi:DUF892 family protein [Deinococcus aestuarii]|uniref:DUF892 family protein n=1 Tax=Deinococcus aestuarii TaxID=2774531 RepID=UPI001C0E00F9|nr:DUF892 family protein [Deinococcus aestuarii]